MAYERVGKGNPKRTKIAIVGRMRQLAIRMWREGLAVVQAEGGAPKAA